MPASADVFNVYEYLRGSYTSCITRSQKPYLSANDYDVIDIQDNKSHQKYTSKVNDQFYKYVVWTDETQQKLSFINNLYKSKIIKREKFDRDGRLFAIQELDETGKVLIEDLIHLDGHLALQRYFGDNNHLTKIVIYNRDGSVKETVLDEAQLVDYWLKQIIDPTQKHCFLIDRNPAWNIALRNFHRETGHLSISIVHSSHLVEMEDDLIAGRLNSNFKPILENQYIVDHIVTLTEHQKSDILKRFPNKKNIVVIPHSLDEIPPVIPFEQRNQHKIVALSRLAPEKQIIDMVLMMNELVRTHPHVKLYIYGDGSEKAKVIAKIKELNLGDNIILQGYVEDIQLAYENAVFSLLTSRCEGFSLAILESLSYGVPAISYDIPYGPSTMIKNNENGFLVPFGQYSMMANQIRQVIDQKDILTKLSLKAYESIKPFTEEVVAEQWKHILS